MADPYASIADPLPPQGGADPYAAIAEPQRKPRVIGAPMAFNAPTVAPGPPTTQQPTPEPPALPWSDLPGNIPKSAGNFVNALAQPFIHPIDTAKAVGDIGMGIVSKGRAVAQNVMGIPSDVDRKTVEAGADAAGNALSDRYGSARRVRNTIISDPVGAAADASLVLGGAGATLPGRVGSVVSKAGAVVDPITQTGNALKLGAKGAEAVTSNALGITTGGGATSVRAAARAGKEGGEAADAFQGAMRGNTSIEDTVALAKSAVDQVRQDRSAAYKSGMAKVSNDSTVMDFAPIESAVDKASEVGSFKGRSGTGPAVTTEPKAAGIVSDMRKVVEDWKKLDPAEYHTPEGIDALKRTLGNFRDSTLPNTPERVAADRVYTAVRAELTKQAPDYAKVMEAYSEASDKLKEVTKTLSLGEKATGDTAGRKLLSATRNNAQTNYGQRVKLIDELAQNEPTLPYQIAGHAMNSLAPQGVIGRGGLVGSVVANPGNALLAPFFSPRVVGEGAYYLGKGAGMGENALNLLRINEANVRRAGRGAYQAGRLQEAR